MQDKKWLYILLLAIASIGANFWGYPVYVLDAAKNAACAMEMLQRGDWVTPTFNGELRTDKPPLHYYFMMISYSLFGVSAFSARLFSVLMGVSMVMVLFFFTRRMENERTAFFAALIVLSSLFVCIQFHMAVPDPYFIFFLTTSWLSFACGHQTGKDRYYYVSYASVALAFMAKGPLAVVLSGMVLLPFLQIQGKLNGPGLRRISVWIGIGIFLAIVLPWWIAVSVATDGEWPAAFIWGHNVGRFIAPFEGHGSFPGLAVVIYFACMLPLGVYLPKALYAAWQDREVSPLVLICALGVIAVLVFFSISRSFLPTYIGPAIPFGAVVIGRYLDGLLARQLPVSRMARLGSVGVFVISLLVPFFLYQVISQDKWIGDLPNLAWLFFPLPVGAMLASVYLFLNRRKEALVSHLLAFWLVGILFFYVAVPRIIARNPVSASLPVIENSGREVLGYYFFNAAYVFAFKQPIKTFYTPQVIQAYSEGKSVLVVTRKEYEAELVAAGFRVIFEKPYLFENSIAIVLINGPDIGDPRWVQFKP
ncbi:MAG: glycosyltransferase family 39 protein [Cytophagales bacterium]|nr:glycosyltransferase family 39 protein [Cytophagales bacterium]